GSGMMRAGGDGAIRRRIETTTGRNDELDRIEEALVLGNVGVHHRGDLRHDVAPRVAEGRVRLQLGAIVRAGEVDGQLLACDRHLAVDVDVAIALGVVVDVDVRLVHTVAPTAHLFAKAAGGVADHVIDGGAHGGGAVARQHFLQ